ncbi:hypothetical protein Ciccas_006967 [Cichlidogyrus casuarinus]|uniref:Acyltransferase 3 domain-containing protein n=1 Tax=Cichlidogyrus casuarinus TaxID=1844966 RepID=A0ABD2Q5H9_9PLAT
MSVLYGLYGIQSQKYTVTTAVAALYNGSYHVVWSIGLAIMCYFCAIRWYGPIRGLLDWAGFRIFSRLSYSIYLVHPCVIFLIFTSLLIPERFTLMIAIMWAFPVFWVSFTAAIILYLTAEAPFGQILQVLFDKN